MTDVEKIATLPAPQQDAARALVRGDDPYRVADAVHAGVSDPIVPSLSGLSVVRLHDLTAALDERDRRLAAFD